MATLEGFRNICGSRSKKDNVFFKFLGFNKAKNFATKKASEAKVKLNKFYCFFEAKLQKATALEFQLDFGIYLRFCVYKIKSKVDWTGQLDCP